MAGELGAGGGTGQVVARGPDGGESEEMVVLGVAPPDPGEHRNAVCLVAYSEGRGLVRIYPVPTRTRVSRWDVISVCLEKNPDDPRPESMRIRGSGSEWRALHKRIRYAGRLGKEARTKLLGELVGKFCYGCAGDMDGGRASLGMVRPDVIEGFFADRDDPELRPEPGSAYDGSYTRIPVITYRCPACRYGGRHEHRLHERRSYEYLRRRPHAAGRLWPVLGMGDPRQKTLLVSSTGRRGGGLMVVGIFGSGA